MASTKEFYVEKFSSLNGPEAQGNIPDRDLLQYYAIKRALEAGEMVKVLSPDKNLSEATKGASSLLKMYGNQVSVGRISQNRFLAEMNKGQPTPFALPLSSPTPA